jgi:hypothetical protein
LTQDCRPTFVASPPSRHIILPECRANFIEPPTLRRMLKHSNLNITTARGKPTIECETHAHDIVTITNNKKRNKHMVEETKQKKRKHVKH